jgi:DNA-binding Lrp family transcriptional regulator
MGPRDKSILTAIQAELPAVERPYEALSLRMGINADELMVRVRRMVQSGMIRRIGPIFDSRQLGYVSTLAAARVAEDELADVAATVSKLPGVTHNYERLGAYNLWFTLTAPSADALGQTLETLRQEAGVTHLYSLPALAVYKIRVQFDMIDEPTESPAPEPATTPQGQQNIPPHPHPLSHGGARGDAPEALTDEQKNFVRLIQDGIAVEPDPYAIIAAKLKWSPSQVVMQIRAWLATGVIRRLGAVVRHRELGFLANGMAVFAVPPERIDEAGRRLAEFSNISHCYQRPPLPDFPYSLYAMVHGKSEEEVREAVGLMAEAVGITEHDVLFSVREFKKTSMRYFVDMG